jgi:hypothetical protein
MSISHSELRRLLHYDPETGRWKWLIPPRGRYAGARAGYIHKSPWGPRIFIVISGKRYRASKLAWFYTTGEWPILIVDHKNRNTIDDRWENLRLATGTQNNANCKIRSHNRVGLKGVQKHRLRWRALIGSGKNRIVIASLDCPAAAHFAYIVEADKRYGEFARAR